MESASLRCLGRQRICHGLLLNNGAPVEAKPTSGLRTPIFCAVITNSVVVVRLLLSKGDSVSARDAHSRTPLHCAALFAGEDVVTALVEVGAEIEAKNVLGMTPLHDAAQGNNEAAVRLLISKGANIEARDNQSITPPLHRAALAGCEASARVLIEAGADHAATNMSDHRLVDLARQEHKWDLARLLLSQSEQPIASSEPDLQLPSSPLRPGPNTTRAPMYATPRPMNILTPVTVVIGPGKVRRLFLGIKLNKFAYREVGNWITGSRGVDAGPLATIEFLFSLSQ
jgi:ankyrin repeat protein